MESDIKELIGAVNKKLEDGEPDNISTREVGSYEQSGYKPQSVVDAMNDVLGVGSWGFDVFEGSFKGTTAVIKVGVWIDGVDFKPTAYGQGFASGEDRKTWGDAMKGAQTDALKKALSYFGIGARAYRGELSSDEKKNAKKDAVKTESAHNAPEDFEFADIPLSDPCPECGGEVHFRADVSKSTGKPYMGSFCQDCKWVNWHNEGSLPEEVVEQQAGEEMTESKQEEIINNSDIPF